jgi:hypothetical protein
MPPSDWRDEGFDAIYGYQTVNGWALSALTRQKIPGSGITVSDSNGDSVLPGDRSKARSRRSARRKILGARDKPSGHTASISTKRLSVNFTAWERARVLTS